MLLSKENITLVNLIKIQQCFGAGSIKAARIFNVLRDADLLDCAFDDLSINEKLDKKDSKRLLSYDDSNAHKIIDDCIKNQINIITVCDSKYPNCLRFLDDFPIVLYYLGDLCDFDNTPLVSIVGPRKISEFGKKAAFSLGKRLALGGITVVSGAALGADTFAHTGALHANCKTIAVLGCGICYDYLPANRSLRKDISKNGCLISEYPPYAPATKYSFPIRNRLISGLSLATVVIEASLKSGSLITARLANEQGRDVFVIPGNPMLENYKGSNALLRDGAIPLLDANDIFNLYISKFPDKINVTKAFDEKKANKNGKISKKLNISLSKNAEIVYNYLNKQKFTVDDLLGLDMTDDDILSALTDLEIEGLIKALPGGVYEVIYS